MRFRKFCLALLVLAATGNFAPLHADSFESFCQKYERQSAQLNPADLFSANFGLETEAVVRIVDLAPLMLEILDKDNFPLVQPASS